MLPRSRSLDQLTAKKQEINVRDPGVNHEGQASFLDAKEEKIVEASKVTARKALDEEVFFVCGSVLANNSFFPLPDENKEDVAPADLNTFYTPFRINTILANYFAEEGFTIKNFVVTETHQNEFPVLTILEKDGTKISVFNVVRDKDIENGILSDKVIPTLDRALALYTAQPELYCEKTLIPVAEAEQRHFRFLLIAKRFNGAAITYYDSRASLVGNAQQLYHGLRNLSAMFQQPVLASEVHGICKKYFVCDFEERYLGHQALMNATDCGPYTVEYIRHVAQGLPLRAESKFEDIKIIRAKHQDFSRQQPETMIEDIYIPTL